MKDQLENFKGIRLISQSDELHEVMASNIIYELREGQPSDEVDIKNLTEQALKKVESKSDAYLLERSASDGVEFSGSKREDFIKKLTKAVRNHILLVVTDVLRRDFDDLSQSHKEAMNPKMSPEQKIRQDFSDKLFKVVQNLPHPNSLNPNSLLLA